MESTNQYLEESHMQHLVRAAYQEYWRRLLQATSMLPEEELGKLSNPFLLKVLPAYRKAQRKVLFVGQETNGWELFKTTLDQFSSSDEVLNRENTIDYLQWMYEDFRFRRKWDYTPYWSKIRRLFQVISPEDGDDSFLNTQLVRLDYNHKRPPHHIEELLQKEFNVLPLEIQALAPDIIIFVTGPYYDDRLLETFRYVKKEAPVFQTVEGFTHNELVRVCHKVFPYHTYRTYHPNYLQQSPQTFMRIENALKNLLQHIPIRVK